MNDKSESDAATSDDGAPHYRLELYMIGTTPSSSRAVVNLRRFCEERLRSGYQLDVIDVAANREVAREQQIIAAPTLIVRSPLPEKRLIGDLSDEERLRKSLNV